jgi:ferredoxin
MSFIITDKCVGCQACYLVCPNQAVYPDPDSASQFKIHPKRCLECAENYPDPQCASICPVEEAIVDRHFQPLNPLGSLIPLPVCGSEG